MFSSLKGFLLIVPLKATRDTLKDLNFYSAMCILTPRCDAHHRALVHRVMHTSELDSTGVMHTAESDSTELCVPRSLTSRGDAHHRVFWENLRTWLSSMMHTPELDLAVWCTLLSLTPWSDAHSGAWLHSTVGCTLQSLTLRGNAHPGVWLCRVMHTTESDSAVGCTPWNFLKI